MLMGNVTTIKREDDSEKGEYLDIWQAALYLSKQ
jgi:hypothetical protein